MKASHLLSSAIFSSVLALSPTGSIIVKIGIDMPYQWDNSVSSLIDQVNVAFIRIDQLNNQNSSLISPNARLQGVWANPGVQASAAITKAFALTTAPYGPVAAMIGSGFSSRTTLSAYISNVASNGPIPQCDGSSTSPALSVKGSYPTFFRTIPTDAATGVAMANFVFSRGWSFVATAYSDEAYGSGLNSAFVTAARSLNITVATQQSCTSPGSAPGISSTVALNMALNIQSTNAKIILYFGYDYDLLSLLTQANAVGLWGTGYSWITADAMTHFKEDYPNLISSWAGVLFFFPLERDPNPTTEAFEAYFNLNHNSVNITSQYSNFPPQAGDLSYQNASSSFLSYDYFCASCVDILAMYMDSAVKNYVSTQSVTTDEGALYISKGNWSGYFQIANLNNFNTTLTPSGYLNFDSNGDRLGNFDILAFNTTNGFSTVGRYSSASNVSTLAGVIWPGNTTAQPVDKVDPNSVALYLKWTDPIGQLGLALFIIGMILWVATFAGYMYFSKEKIIRQSAFLVGVFMQFCIFVGYFELLAMIGVPSVLLCVVDAFILPLVFSFYYGLLFAKNLRIYKVFNSSAGMARWNDYFVTAYGLIMTLPSLIIVLIWVGLSVPQLSLVNPSLGSYYYTCSSSDASVQNGVVPALLAVNGIILICNLFMAFLTRNVNSRYSETKLISLTIYNLTMVLIFSLSIIYTTSLSYNLRAVIKIIALFYVLTFNTIATFTVKVYQSATSSSQMKSSTSLSQSQIGEKSQTGAAAAAGGAAGVEGMPHGVGKNPKLPQSSALVKPIGGLQGFLGENRKVYIRAESDFGLVFYPAVKNNVEDNKTSASPVGTCWNGAQANVFEVLVSSPNELKIQIDRDAFMLTFDEESVATVWNTYFQAWSLKAEGKNRGGKE